MPGPGSDPNWSRRIFHLLEIAVIDRYLLNHGA
jgi:hypothetical protein